MKISQVVDGNQTEEQRRFAEEVGALAKTAFGRQVLTLDPAAVKQAMPELSGELEQAEAELRLGAPPEHIRVGDMSRRQQNAGLRCLYCGACEALEHALKSNFVEEPVATVWARVERQAALIRVFVAAHRDCQIRPLQALYAVHRAFADLRDGVKEGAEVAVDQHAIDGVERVALAVEVFREAVRRDAARGRP